MSSNIYYFNKNKFYASIIGSFLLGALIFGIVGGFIGNKIGETKGNEEGFIEGIKSTYCGINVNFNQSFYIDFWNDSTHTYDSRYNCSYDLVYIQLSIISIDPILIEYFKANLTLGINLYEILNQTDILTYLQYTEFFIANDNMNAFLINIENIFQGEFESPENLTEYFLGIDLSQSITLNISKPFVLAGMSLMCLKKGVEHPKLLSDDLFLYGTGFISNTSLFDINIAEILESPFFIKQNQYLNLTINGIGINKTDDFWFSMNYNIELDGNQILREKSKMPLNVFSFLNALIQIFNEIAERF